MKSDHDPERLDALAASESDAALARALKAIAQDRPTKEELARVRGRLDAALQQQVIARKNAALLQPAAGLIVVGAALFSLLPAPTRQSRVDKTPAAVDAAADSGKAPAIARPSVADSSSTIPALQPTEKALPTTPALALDPPPTARAERAQHGKQRKASARTRESARLAWERDLQSAPQLPATQSVSSVAATGSAEAQPSPAVANELSGPLRHAEVTPVAEPRADRVNVAKPSLAVDEATLLQRAHERAPDDPRAALHWLDEHKRYFPHGMLSQEREVLAIHLLRALARDSEAAQRVQAFRRDFPRSIYLPRLGGVERRD